MLQVSNKEIADFYIKLYNISLKNWKDPRIRLSPEQDTISKFSHNGNDTIHIKRLIKLIDKKLQNKNKSKINIESKLESFIRKIVKEEQQRMNEVEYSPLTRNLYNKLRKYQDKISSKAFDNLLLKYNINPNDYYAGNLSDKVDPITKNPKLKFREVAAQTEIKIVMSGDSSFMKRFAIPQFKKAGIKIDIDDIDGILEIRTTANETLIEKIANFLETKDNEGAYGGWLIEESKLKESSSQAEIRDLAIDLIDYLGGQLPTQGYTRNQRIMDYFRELGYKDNDPMIHKIYNLALKLNR